MSTTTPSAPSPAPDKISYPAHCHCNATRFTVLTPPLATTPVNSCNCSICVKHAYLLVYPRAQDVVFQAGYDELQSYRFASGRWPHRFCGVCGASVLVEKGGVWAVNVRLFEGVEVEELRLRYSHGRTEHNPEYAN